MREFRDRLGSPAGRIAGIVFAVAALVACVWVVRHHIGRSPAAQQSRDRLFICAQSGKTFHHTLRAGETYPVSSPYSGGRTGYPAELCNWTADGKVSPTATPVLLNSYLGKSGPTFCPTCGRLVVGHNPPAEASRQPPPTRQQYTAAVSAQRRER